MEVDEGACRDERAAICEGIGACTVTGTWSLLERVAAHEHEDALVEGHSALYEVRPAYHVDISRLSFDDAATVDA
jgi:hypothetical protein